MKKTFQACTGVEPITSAIPVYQLGARHFVGSYLIREVMFITAFPSDQLFNQFSEKTESGVIVNNNSLKKPIGRQSANSAPTVSRQVFLWSCST